MDYRKLEALVACQRNPHRAFALRGRGYNFDILFHGNHVAVFPKLKICFNRVKKSGNTTISAFLTDISGDSETESADEFKRALLKPRAMPVKELQRLPSYYSFVVVRDPYSRALSAFLQKVAHGQSLKYAYCAGFGNSTPEGFHAFLTFLVMGGLYRDRHFWPQSDLLYQPIKNYSRVARLENLVTDMRIILTETGQDPALAELLASPHKVEAGTTKITSATSKLGAFYNARSSALVHELYLKDFEMFGYPTYPKPNR